MTFQSKDIIKKLIEGKGIYEGDPQMSSIWKYNLYFDNRELYAVFTNETHNDIYISPFTKNPILLWNQENGITQAGEEFMKEESKT